MKQDLALVVSLRRVLESVSAGVGLAQSLVTEFSSKKGQGREVARLVLLGVPVAESLRPISDGRSPEAAMLASVVIESTRSSTEAVGEGSEGLSSVLERWVKLRENNRLEWKAQEFRGLIASGVLGAVAAMISSLGPLVSGLGLASATSHPGPLALTMSGALLVGVSSSLLGTFLSGRRFVLDLVLCESVFAVVTLLAFPLANVPIVSPWGIK